MQFFKHQSNMRNDLKLKRGIKRYGLKYYGLYNLIIESIVESLSSSSPLPELEDTAQDIAEQYNDDTAAINEMMAHMLNQGLFEINEINGRILCHKIYKFLDKAQTRSLEIRQMITNYQSNSIQQRQKFIYIAHDGINFKIGITSDLTSRLKSLKTSNINLQYKLIKSVCGDGFTEEAALHKEFADKRLEYEWFCLDDNDVELLKSNHGFTEYENSLVCHETNQDRHDIVEYSRVDIEEGTKTKRFIPPAVIDVTKYLSELKETRINPQTFCDYYESKGWMVGKNKMKSWKAAVRTWVNKQNENKPKSKYNDL